ncbi:MAG: Mo-dependent nitrogenase C-terminal domain-containing protein [Cyanobacteria bacterium J06621_11]
MTFTTQTSPYTQPQIEIWLRGLLTVAWADGNFDPEEKEMIHAMVDSEFAPDVDIESLDPIEPAALVELELSAAAAQNFLRMAVMVALSNGTYSEAENEQVMAFAEAIAPDPDTLATLRSTLEKLTSTYLQAAEKEADESQPIGAASSLMPPDEASGEAASGSKLDPLKPAREWLDQLSVEDPRLARFVCKLVPSQCPFERDVKLFGKKVVHIPPMCKINPLYEQLVGLRFRALSYLADDVGEDVTAYL